MCLAWQLHRRLCGEEGIPRFNEKLMDWDEGKERCEVSPVPEELPASLGSRQQPELFGRLWMKECEGIHVLNYNGTKYSPSGPGVGLP